jgi:hypothetical protein
MYEDYTTYGFLTRDAAQRTCDTYDGYGVINVEYSNSDGSGWYALVDQPTRRAPYATTSIESLIERGADADEINEMLGLQTTAHSDAVGAIDLGDYDLCPFAEPDSAYNAVDGLRGWDPQGLITVVETAHTNNAYDGIVYGVFDSSVDHGFTATNGRFSEEERALIRSIIARELSR